LGRSPAATGGRAAWGGGAIIGMALATMTNLVGPGVIVVMGESVTDCPRPGAIRAE
jgi:hypothetical protein